MMIPKPYRCTGIISCGFKNTKNYVNRKIKGKDEEPVLSYDPEIQRAQALKVARGEE